MKTQIISLIPLYAKIEKRSFRKTIIFSPDHQDNIVVTASIEAPWSLMNTK